MVQKVNLQAEVPMELAGQRFDQIAAQLFSDYSRSRLQAWIKSGELQVNSQPMKAKEKLFGGESLEVKAELEDEGRWVAESITLDVVYEDEHILVINKPAGLVVHPGAGHADGTLLNALLHHCPEVGSVPRAGIVHRLDKDTTGLMVVAKSLIAHAHLVEQLQERTVSREYEAVVNGVMTGGGMVDEPIGRHPSQRIKMAVNPTGKEAITHYRLMKKYRSHTHICLKLETGRTHQIRVHMSHKRYPLVGDLIYGGRLRLPKGASEEFRDFLQSFKRQALHARRLGLIHPVTEEYMEWEVDLPDDFSSLLNWLDEDIDGNEE